MDLNNLSCILKNMRKSLFVVTLLMFFIMANSAFAASIYVSPSSVSNPSLTSGSTFKVDVKVGNVINLYGFDFKVYWNTNLLSLVNAKVNTKNLWFDSIKWLDSNKGFYEAAYSAKSPYNGFTGSTSLATLTFKVLSTGTCSIEIRDAKLGDKSAFPITYTVSNGSFNNQPVCTCGSWVKKGCESDGTCTICYWSRTCTPGGCSQTSRTTRLCS
jgi:hypothetical protein